MPRDTLEVRSLGQIEEASIQFGDLTVLVGPQGAGKSLLLQTWKLALDYAEILGALRGAGFSLADTDELLDAYFGEGMHNAWTSATEVRVRGTPLHLSSLLKKGRTSKEQPAGKAFFVPAHRALLMTEGWPSPFMRLKADTPTVARLFSQSLYDRFTGKEQAGSLFPVERRLKQSIRDLIDAAIFHRGEVILEKAGLQTRLALKYENASLPFMTWTAGQREFTPLLLGLYRVLPPRKVRKDPQIEWVIIEEPEMGLHPQALNAVMALVLDLLWRGYRVVLSTHSPFVLDVVFAVRELRNAANGVSLLRDAFGMPSNGQVNPMLSAALKKDYRTYALAFNPNGRVTSKDISDLDPASSDEDTRNWGGLTGFSGRFSNAIARGVAERAA